MWLACSLMWHYASVYGTKAKGSSGLPFTSKVQSKSDRLLLFSEIETSELVPQSLWPALVSVYSVSTNNNALIFAR